MALNSFKCNYLTPLHFKGSMPVTFMFRSLLDIDIHTSQCSTLVRTLL